MSDLLNLERPRQHAAILADSEALGFKLASDLHTGGLLRTLAATKPGGRLLELGTGTGVSAAWLLAGMDAAARLTSVDSEPRFQNVARKHLGGDPRCTFVSADGAEFLQQAQPASYDLLFADAWAGKFTQLDEALAALAPGGIYVIDDLLPQEVWPPDHQPKVDQLLAQLDSRRDLHITKLHWSTGLLVAAKVA